MRILESFVVVFETLFLVFFLEAFLEPHMGNQILAYAVSIFCCDSQTLS